MFFRVRKAGMSTLPAMSRLKIHQAGGREIYPMTSQHVNPEKRLNDLSLRRRLMSGVTGSTHAPSIERVQLATAGLELKLANNAETGAERDIPKAAARHCPQQLPLGDIGSSVDPRMRPLWRLCQVSKEASRLLLSQPIKALKRKPATFRLQRMLTIIRIAGDATIGSAPQIAIRISIVKECFNVRRSWDYDF